eukprot:PLAT13270.1.p2 GENE.PLAT13270.1~~PLAT13270.1.p2  ORF type:complete len:379 (-),score=164.97 PLAT13270.1:171-1286(-)
MQAIWQAKSTLWYECLRPVHNRLLGKVVSGYSNVLAFQRLCGVTPPTKDKPAKRGFLPLHILFTIGAALGDEVFYILAMPALFWVIDAWVARQVVLVWVATYWLGQVMKDGLRLPRPPSDLVAQLETHYSAEYGYPSTHTTAGVSMPFMFMWAAYQRWDFHLPTGIAIATAYALANAFSRFYMGVHSLPDVEGGFLLGCAILAAGMLRGAALDAFLVTADGAWAMVLVGGALLILLYPAPDRWTNSYGDTALIMAAGMGVYVASNALLPHPAVLPPPRVPLPPLTWHVGGIMLKRVLCGLPLLLLTRAVVKATMYKLLPALLPPSDAPPGKRFIVEIPTKVLTYGLIGINALYTAPLIFNALDLHLPPGFA